MPIAKNRDEHIDFIKGCLMWCVVYGHMISALCAEKITHPFWLHDFVRTFDIPLFMIISGFYFKRSIGSKGAVVAIRDRATGLVVPIIFWMSLIGCFHFFNGTYYFLKAVFLSSLLMSIVCVIPLPRGIRVFRMMCCLVLILLMHIYKVPWNLFYLFPFFAVGFFLGDTVIKIKERTFLVALCLFSLLLCFWDTRYTPWNVSGIAWKDDYGLLVIYPYRFTLSIIGCLVIGTILSWVYKYGHGSSRLVQFLMHIGKETLALYVLQALVVEIGLRKTILMIGGGRPDWLTYVVGYVLSPILSLLTIFSLNLLAWKIKSLSFICWVFGFKMKRNFLERMRR